MEGDYQIDEGAIRKAAQCALQVADARPPLALTVTLTSAERIRELNRDFAGLDEATDVLSFGAEDEPYAVDPGEPPYIGDVIIAYPVAEDQALAAGQSVLAELQMLAIHGVLHLLGHDHATPEQRAQMWALESAAIDAVRSTGDL
jgi:probable rRNA maturation factor